LRSRSVGENERATVVCFA